MLSTRIISGAILGPLFLLIVYLGNPWFYLLAAAIGLVIAYEFARMTGDTGPGPRGWNARVGLMAVTPLLAVIALDLGGPIHGLAMVALAAAIIAVADQARGRPGLHAGHAIIPYAAIPALALAYVMDIGGYVSIFWLLGVIWATDIGAYAFGRMIGGPKLAPRISPNKTWSGALGGLVSAVVCSALVLWGFGVPIGAAAFIAAIFISIVSQGGDLFESKIKRRYGVKDSGALIPGHGGLMDRFDGLWAAAPVAAMVCVVLGGGVESW